MEHNGRNHGISSFAKASEDYSPSVKENKKVMVFGVFDRLHPGHCSFLEQASRHGNEVIAVVTRDEVVRELKKKTPTQGEDERTAMVRGVSYVARAVLGDAILGSYDVLREHKPDIICLGYDQNGLAQDLRFRMAEGLIPSIELSIMEAHKPEFLHTSLLTNM